MSDGRLHLCGTRIELFLSLITHSVETAGSDQTLKSHKYLEYPSFATRHRYASRAEIENRKNQLERTLFHNPRLPTPDRNLEFFNQYLSIVAFRNISDASV